jgi:hypothetical protein
MVVSTVQAGQHRRHQLLAEGGLRAQQLRQLRAAIDHQHALLDSFGCEAMQVTAFQPEYVAGEVEGFDLSPTVRQKLHRAYRARDDLVEMAARIALSEDFLTGGKPAADTGPAVFPERAEICDALQGDGGGNRAGAGGGEGLHSMSPHRAKRWCSIQAERSAQNSGLVLRDSTEAA